MQESDAEPFSRTVLAPGQTEQFIYVYKVETLNATGNLINKQINATTA
jgi:hypothetical protein